VWGKFARDSPLEGARFEPSVPRRERVDSVPSRLTPRVDLPRCRRGGMLTGAYHAVAASFFEIKAGCRGWSDRDPLRARSSRAAQAAAPK
jgi:hypothetical protein